jgi:histidinol-phosphate aminotransferase
LLLEQSLVDALHQMGLHTIPSSANFILFTGFKQDAPQLWSALLEKGVLIRDVGLSGYLRVTIGNEAENQLFISALKELHLKEIPMRTARVEKKDKRVACTR